MTHYPTTLAILKSQLTRRVTVELPYITDCDMNPLTLREVDPEYIPAVVALEVAKLITSPDDSEYTLLDFDIDNHFEQVVMPLQPTRPLDMDQLCNGLYGNDTCIGHYALDELYIPDANIIYICIDDDVAQLTEPKEWDFAVIYSQEAGKVNWCCKTYIGIEEVEEFMRVSLGEELDLYFAQKLVSCIKDTHLANELRLPKTL